MAELAFGSIAASADGNDTEAWIVSVGDSFISGEAGRWAGNVPGMSTVAIDTGPDAYFDVPVGESEAGCHRSRSAEIHIGVMRSLNLACSGAKVDSEFSRPMLSSRAEFKPGLDFFDDSKGHRGQAALLRDFATDHDVSGVVISIGGNNFGFSSFVKACLRDFLVSPRWYQKTCSEDSSESSRFDGLNAGRVSEDIARGIQNIRSAMSGAGYPDGSYRIIVQTYPSILPPSSDMRYPESMKRQTEGGCGFWDRDVNFAGTIAMRIVNDAVRAAVSATSLPKASVLEVSDLFAGHRLCESGTRLLPTTNTQDWTAAGASGESEWVSQVHTLQAILGTKYELQEGLHPNYWGQLALRNCLRQMIQMGSGNGTCFPGSPGLDDRGEPEVNLVAW